MGFLRFMNGMIHPERTEPADAVVVGAGVVGLAVARALALAGREVLVVEAAGGIGTATSSRNSEVIHAGIYYPAGSLKAALCVRGRELLYRYCSEHGVSHSRLGKLIVAAHAEEVGGLRQLREQARANGVGDLAWLTGAEARAMEPELDCEAALLSPSTGIVDVHELMLAYQGDLERAGGLVAFNGRVTGGAALGDGILLHVDAGGERLDLLCASVVNCAGLHAQEVAAGIVGLNPDAIPPRHLAKGNYFRLTRRSPFRHLVYPMPSGGGAGVHLTLDLAGQARFGPDVEWVDAIDYRVDASRRKAFEASIREYWPGLPDDAIAADYCGIRPKLHPRGQTSADFVIQDAAPHGAPGLVNLYGIESPGLTSSLAIADHVAEIVETTRTKTPGSRSFTLASA